MPQCKICNKISQKDYVFFDENEQIFFCDECYNQYLVDAFPNQLNETFKDEIIKARRIK